MKNNAIHIVLAVILIVLLALLSVPFGFWMPPAVTMAVLLLAAVMIAGWAGFVMKEKAADEREAYHRMEAGRIAYLSGIGVLLLAFIVEGFYGHIDIWITLSLAVMVVSKLAARIYFEKHN